MCKVEWEWSGIALLEQLMGVAGAVVTGVVTGMWEVMKSMGKRALGKGGSESSDGTINDDGSPGRSSSTPGGSMHGTSSQQACLEQSMLERSIAMAREAEPWYVCGYCGVSKPSTSAGGDLTPCPTSMVEGG